MSAVARRANRLGRLDLHVTGAEKWNQPNFADPSTERVMKEGELYDVEGHSWTDIHGFYTLNFLSPKDWWLLARATWSWVKDMYDMRSLSFTVATIPFRRVWHNWVWTVESFDVIRNDMAEAEMEKLGIEYTWQARDVYTAKFAEIKAAYTLADIFGYLSEHYYPIASQVFFTVWVSKTDPTVIVANEEFYKYDLKDGWSDKMIGFIIQEWFKAVYGTAIDIRLIQDTDTFSPFVRILLRAVEDSKKLRKNDGL